MKGGTIADATSALGTSGAITTTTTTKGPGKTRTVPPRSLTERLKYFSAAFAIQRVILPPLIMMSEFKNYCLSPDYPDLVKSYPARKDLPIRVFYPPGYEPASPNPPKLPTLLTIHGGGFVLGNPHDNDGWNRQFVTANPGFLVIALSYLKAPASPFPNPIKQDLAALIPLVISDESLPVDPDKVSLAGWSAGGNLALAVSQLPSVRPLVRAVVPLYPIVDWAPPQQAKAQTRRYKPCLGGLRGRDRDYLLAMSPLFNWAYVSPGQDCTDPLLSPIYAKREDLPANVFIVGCEMDLLGQEAWRMICGLAGRRIPLLEEVVGREAVAGEGELVTEGDERYSWEEVVESYGDGGTGNGRAQKMRYKWLLVPDQVHGFDQDSIGSLALGDKKMMEDARKKRDKVIGIMGKWLMGVFEEDKDERAT